MEAAGTAQSNNSLAEGAELIILPGLGCSRAGVGWGRTPEGVQQGLREPKPEEQGGEPGRQVESRKLGVCLSLRVWGVP